MDPQTQIPPQPTVQKKSPVLVLMIIAWIIVVLLLIGLVVIYITSSNKAKQLSAIILDQEAKIQEHQSEIKKLKAGIDDTKVVINTMGLQFPKSTENNNIVYIIDLKDDVKPSLSLTSKSLMVAQLNASRLVPPPVRNACGAAESPAGTITSYKADETINGQKVTTIQSADLRKIGDLYYFYQKAPATCSVDSNVQKEQAIATQHAQHFFNSLELKQEK